MGANLEMAERNEDPVREVNLRIKRLQAAIEMAREEADLEAKLKRIPRPNTGITMMVVLAVVWIGGGFLLLYVVERRYGVLGVGIPIKIYLAFVLALLVPLIWFYISKRRYRVHESRDRVMASEVVIKEFYEPLKDALESGNDTAISALADKLIEDSVLSESLRASHEGDPHHVAYAMYVYVRFKEGLVGKEEVEEALNSVGNRVLRSMLSSLLDRERNA